MTAPHAILMPLRVPELGSSLGRLIVPRRTEPPWVPLDDVREELATRVLDLAGEGRRAAAAEQRERVLSALGRAAWTAAWEGAVQRVAERVANCLDAELTRTARQVRMPPPMRKRRLLSGVERRALAARLASGGGPFISALDEVEAAGEAARGATVSDPEVHEQWQDALRGAARRLEAAWLSLEESVAAERRRWSPEIAATAAWRPPMWPVLVVWVPLAAVALWLGLVLGGYLPAPVWLADLLGF
ncbi:MAG TPA: hypothetical protein VFK78_04710 [Gemmatimonadales bacterium]|nr:hypothetical protein [Gemmatimonadales bacterium]